MQTISSAVWAELVAENQRAHKNGWAQLGVFATGVGPGYQGDGANGILYVGKSPGPLGSKVGSGFDQLLSSRSSTEWMISRKNKSDFWRMIERIDPTRQRIAWTNICKMDRFGGKVPPTLPEWRQVREVCLKALRDELLHLRPKVVLFATNDFARQDILRLLSELGFVDKKIDFDDGWTNVLVAPSAQEVVLTRHPQGWPSAERDRVVNYVASLLS